MTIVTTTATGELTDSTRLAGDVLAMRDRIAADGYLFFRGLLDPALVRTAGHNGLAHLQAAGWTEPGADPVTAPPSGPVRAVRMRDAFADAGYRRIFADPAFVRIGFLPALTDVMTRLMGPAAFCYPVKLPRVVYPTSAVPQQPGGWVHKDYRSVQDMFTCWVPLGDVPRSLGGLALQPGSQHRSHVRPRPLTALEPGWLTTDYRAGDVLVFHCLTTHAALPNREGRMRFSGEYRWQLADQPAPRRLVVGPGGWEIGARLLSRFPWWRPVPPGLQLVDDGTGERAVLPAPPSRFVAFEN